MSSSKAPFGIVVAMHSEARHLLVQADSREPIDAGPFTAWKATFGASESVVVISGIGMVLSAAATQWLIGEFQPQAILNFGCTGAHRHDLNPGDVVIGSEAVPHFNIQIHPDGNHHYVGFVSEEGHDLLHVSDENVANISPVLRERAVSAVSSRPIEPWPGSADSPAWHVGAVGSADIWTQQPSKLRAIHDQHQTLCEDMEAASIGRIANIHVIPFLTVKDISNNEFQKETNLADFSEFPFEEVGKRSGQVIVDLLRQDEREGSSR